MQELMVRCCRQRRYEDNKVKDISHVSALDPNGAQRNFPVNVYCDIFDADTNRMIARGNTSHDIRRAAEFPDGWTDLKPAVREKLSETERAQKSTHPESANRKKHLADRERYGPEGR